jgi:hypothetical protein
VPEELTLEQRVGKGRAVDRHEAASGPLAAAMDGVGEHLLAGAGLAGEEHRGSGASSALDQLERLLHRCAAGDDALDPTRATLGGHAGTRRVATRLEVGDAQPVVAHDHDIVRTGTAQSIARGRVHRSDEGDQARTTVHGREPGQRRAGRFWLACLDHDRRLACLDHDRIERGERELERLVDVAGPGDLESGRIGDDLAGEGAGAAHPEEGSESRHGYFLSPPRAGVKQVVCPLT